MRGEVPTGGEIPVKSPREQLLEEIQKNKQEHPVGWGRRTFNNFDMLLPVPEGYPEMGSLRLWHKMLAQKDPERWNKKYKDIDQYDRSGMSQRKLELTPIQFYASIDEAVEEHAAGIFQKATELQQQDPYAQSVLAPLMTDLKIDTPESLPEAAIEFIKRVQMTKINASNSLIATKNEDILFELVTETVLDLIDPAKNPEKGAYHKKDLST